MLQRWGLASLGIIIAVLYWPVESMIHAFLLGGKSFLSSLFSTDPNEIWMRTIISVAFVGFGLLAQRGINQQRVFQERLYGERDRLHKIIDNTYDAYVGMDEEGRITGWNRSAETLFGWQMNEAMGQPLAEIIIPERQREAHYKGLKHYKESSVGPWLYKPVYTQAIHRDGSEFVIEMVVTPLQSDDGQEFFAFIRKKSS
jgi:PAS domain S-box-containing protein